MDGCHINVVNTGYSLNRMIHLHSSEKLIIKSVKDFERFKTRLY